MPNKWSRKKQKELIVSLRSGETINSIAKKHERSTNAIEMRLQKIAHDSVEKGNSYEKTGEIMGIKSDRVKQFYEQYENLMKINNIHKNSSKKVSKKGYKKHELMNRLMKDPTSVTTIKEIKSEINRLYLENKILKQLIKDIVSPPV